jgi:heme exporter protein A
VSRPLQLVPSETLLHFEGVTLTRGRRLLFTDLNLTVEAGERLAVTGPNGSGKSSLLRLAAGLLRQDSGLVVRSTVALADERPALDRELRLLGALSFWTGLGGDNKRLEFALNTLDLAALIPVPVRLLSAGQLKRATLARVAATNAPLWLLDEPLNGLDRGGLDDLGQLLDWHTAAGGAVVAASHLILPGEWRTLELGT